jgi:hypothetical protein
VSGSERPEGCGSADEIAAELLVQYGGRYPGFIGQAERYSEGGLRSTARHFASRIAEHEAKLSTASSARSAGLVKHYQDELRVFRDSHAIVKEIMMRRGV